LGVDRAILVSDPVLAGSDTLVTARVLERALRRVNAPTILTGAWSTDSDTGQVGPTVAALRGVPFIGPARQLTRVDPDRWDVVADTEVGWTRWHLSGPCVISLGEKAAKLRKSTESELEAARLRPVERWSAIDLELSASTVGFAGSPTIVAAVEEAVPNRRPHLFSEGSVDQRVNAALAMLPELLGDAVESLTPVPHPAPGAASTDEFLVLATSDTGLWDPAMAGAIGEIRRSLPDHTPAAIWVGGEPKERPLAELGRAGAEHGYWANVRTRSLAPETVASACERVLEERPRSAGVAFPATPFGRIVAATVAAHRGLGLVGDAVRFGSAPNHAVTFAKPAFGGRVVATIECRTRPAMATVRPGALAPAPDERRPPARLHPIRFEAESPRVEPGESVQELDDTWGDLGSARIVLVVGQGVGGPSAIEPLRATAVAWGGALGATRKVVDAGWVPRQLQVGLTGRSLAPQVAVLVGVGGSANHLVGLHRARVLIAVNPDPTAAVLRHVDLGIVGRWEETLPLLETPLAALARSRGY
ncbi:MAG: FAD-binding protein, partial [Thermoplasmata archaeon]|nr:FAD-binding protein [Thermoplasmata archaeon]